MGNGQKLDTNQTVQEQSDIKASEAQQQMPDNQVLETQNEAPVDVHSAAPSESELAESESKELASEKLKSNREVVNYLVEKFPECFIAEGEAKPLKIGIFQELAAELKDDPKVSKTILRSALRQYTASWRYLHGLKAGAIRIDLKGNPCGELEQEHIDHAKQTLKESKERAFARKKANAEKNSAGKNGAGKSDTQRQTTQSARKKQDFKVSSKPKARSNHQHKNKEQAKVKQNLKPVAVSDVKVGASVYVMLGNSPVAGSVEKIEKDGVMVQLSSGMTIKVKPEHLVN